MRSRVLILVPVIGFALFACWDYVFSKAVKPQESVPTQTGKSGPAAKREFLSTDLPNGPVTLEVARAYFDRWGGYAIWDNDVTEFAIDTKTTTWRGRQFFEVNRTSGTFQLREIATLTRPLLDHGVKVLTAMNFTETTAMRDEFYRTHPDVVPGQFVTAADGVKPLPPKPPILHQAPRVTTPPRLLPPETWPPGDEPSKNGPTIPTPTTTRPTTPTTTPPRITNP